MTELYSLEAESRILAILMNLSAIDGVGPARLLLERDQLMAGDFHLPAHGVVYAASQGLLNRGVPADPVTVLSETKGNQWVEEAGGLKWLLTVLELGDNLVSQTYPAYVRQVRELAVRRKLVSVARMVAEKAGDLAVDVSLAMGSASQQLASIVMRRDTFRSLTEVVSQVQEDLVKAQDSATMRLLPTGIRALDGLIGGLPPMLIVVGGRPGAGKSAVAATFVQNLARGGTKVGVFSLEDRAPWLAYRLLSDNSAVSNHALRFRKLTDDEWARAGDGFARMSSYTDRVLVDDRRRMTADDIVQSARNMIVNHGVRAIMIDHLLEVKTAERNARRDLEIAAILGQFRDVSNEYELPVVVFTQLNRGSESKKEPGLTDFKDAGAVEEMARVAIALTRDGDKIGLCVVKNTNGKPGRIEIEFEGAAAMVASVERQGAML